MLGVEHFGYWGVCSWDEMSLNLGFKLIDFSWIVLEIEGMEEEESVNVEDLGSHFCL